jgi:hypothetical protein
MSERDRPFEQLVAEGAFPKYSLIEKFGENPSVDTNSDPEDIWDYGGIYTFSTGADITQVTSSSSSDTSQDVVVIGLDENWSEVSQTVTLTGQAPVVLGTPLLRLYRMYNISPTVLVGDVYTTITGAEFVAGVPDTANEVRGMIQVGNEQTLMCIYTIPAGFIGYLYSSYVTYGKSSSTGAILTVRTRPFNETFKIKSKVALIGAGTSWFADTKMFPRRLQEMTDVLIRCESVEANATALTGGFTILLKDIS